MDQQGKDPQGIGGAAGLTEGGKKRPYCCVERFLYPKSVAKYEELGDESAYVGFKFLVEADFLEGSEPKKAEDQRSAEEKDATPAVCRCACCRFRQFIKPPEGKGGPRVAARQFARYVEDCFYWSDNPERQRELGASPTWQPEPDPPTPYIDCPGMRPTDYAALPPGSPLMPCIGADGKPTGGSYVDGTGPPGAGCHFAFTDHPGMVVRYGSAYEMEFDLVGRILDACNDFAPRATGRLLLERKGEVTKEHPPTIADEAASAQRSADGPDAPLTGMSLREASVPGEPPSGRVGERVCQTSEETIRNMQQQRKPGGSEKR